MQVLYQGRSTFLEASPSKFNRICFQVKSTVVAALTAHQSSEQNLKKVTIWSCWFIKGMFRFDSIRGGLRAWQGDYELHATFMAHMAGQAIQGFLRQLLVEIEIQSVSIHISEGSSCSSWTNSKKYKYT